MKEIELLKTIFKDSPDILEPLNEIDKEIERLNNILDELEKFTDEKIQKNFDECYLEKFNAYIEFNKKIKELRGDNNG